MNDFGKNALGFLCTCILIFIMACKSDPSSNAQTENGTNEATSSTQNSGKDGWSVTSPDGQIQLTLRNQGQGLEYSVTFQNETVIEPSALGLERADQSFAKNMTFVSQSATQKVNTNFQSVSGKSSNTNAWAYESTFTFKNANDSKMDVIIRVYDDGIAFRYRFPDSSAETFTVTKELTTFDLPTNGKAWMQPYDSVGTHQPAYETYFESNIQIGREANNRFNGWAFPALFNINGSKHWLLISESDVNEHYCGMHLDSKATNGRYQLAMPLATEGQNQGTANPSSTLPWTMPWRFITIGANLNTIVESELVSILATESKIADVSWIKSGMSSWSWWSDSDSPKNYNSLKKFVNLSKEMNWAYTLVDANWDKMSGGDLKKLVNYAKTKDVGILVWYNSGGPNNKVTEAPRDLMHDQSTRRAEFKKLQDMGVKGIKVDYWQSDKQSMIQYYLALLQDAADHQLVVNLHGCTLPRGWSRTYPNLLTMEAVKGAEAYKIDSTYPEKAAKQNTILPFTRNVVGPMDYTPLGFSESRYKRLTTRAHELALAIIFESGLVHAADKPSTYLDLPVSERLLLKYLPTKWDETKFQLGWPGKDFIVARRSKSLWYYAGINGENKIKKRRLNLRDAGPGILEIEYTLDVPGEGLKTIFTQGSSTVPLPIEIPPYGGFVMKIRKQ